MGGSGAKSKMKSLTMDDLVRMVSEGGTSYEDDKLYKNLMAEMRRLREEADEADEEHKRIRDELEEERNKSPEKTKEEIEEELGEKIDDDVWRDMRRELRMLGLLNRSNSRLKELEDNDMKTFREYNRRLAAYRIAEEAVEKYISGQRGRQASEFRNKYNAYQNLSQDTYKGFQLKTDNPYFAKLLKDGKATIVEMSPKEYLERITHQVFTKSTLQTTVRGTLAKNVAKYANMMRHGTKFYMPSMTLNERERGQEGRHRALAAMLNGYSKIPVIVIW